MINLLTKKYSSISPEQRKRKIKTSLAASGFLGLSLMGATCGGINVWSLHTWDKYVIKPIEIAANVPSVAENHGDNNSISMETSLKEAKANLNVSRLPNPALIWKTPLTDISSLERLLDKSVFRAGEIGQLQETFETGTVPENASDRVKKAHAKASAKNNPENV